MSINPSNSKPIPFNKPAVTGHELPYIAEAINKHSISGKGHEHFLKACSEWFQKELGVKQFLLLPSCTHALELSALLLEIKPGDEVIMPSYTFVSTANAFVLRGAKIIFVDIRSDTMNMDEDLIEDAITPRTRAIVPVHYAGIACEMDKIIMIAKKHNLAVVEDNAHGLMAKYKGRHLGTIGTMGTFSFHETKNYTSGEGGGFISNDERYIERAEIIRQKGTNRNKFLRGQVDKYSWVDIGSSYVMSELNAAYLYAQLDFAEIINEHRLKLWNMYFESLLPLKDNGLIELPFIPEECEHNAHLFYIKLKDIEERQKMILFLKENNIHSVFHYVPLHSSLAGKKFARFHGEDKYTTKESERLLRLPLYYNLTEKEVERVIRTVKEFF